jgi:hypothetical protein
LRRPTSCSSFALRTELAKKAHRRKRAFNSSRALPESESSSSAGVAKDAWTFTIYGENLTNSNASTLISTDRFIVAQIPLRPRVIGASFSYSFRCKETRADRRIPRHRSLYSSHRRMYDTRLSYAGCLLLDSQGSA